MRRYYCLRSRREHCRMSLHPLSYCVYNSGAVTAACYGWKVRGLNLRLGDIPPGQPDRLWAHPASYAMGTVSLQGAKRPGPGVDHSPHLTPRLSMGRTVHLLPLYASSGVLMHDFYVYLFTTTASVVLIWCVILNFEVTGHCMCWSWNQFLLHARGSCTKSQDPFYTPHTTVTSLRRNPSVRSYETIPVRQHLTTQWRHYSRHATFCAKWLAHKNFACSKTGGHGRVRTVKRLSRSSAGRSTYLVWGYKTCVAPCGSNPYNFSCCYASRQTGSEKQTRSTARYSVFWWLQPFTLLGGNL
jgi:hypothetical protein